MENRLLSDIEFDKFTIENRLLLGLDLVYDK